MKKTLFVTLILFSTHFIYGQLNTFLPAKLDSIYNDDQKYRIQMDSLMKKNGWESNEMHSLIFKMNETDSINVIKVKEILDLYGWLGTEVIGKRGNSALFLVI